MREHPIEQQKKRNPKSFKADGSPKRRWTAAERAARGTSHVLGRCPQRAHRFPGS
ncbi:hypothetical protein JCM18918_3318 [Cutibacterium acnes JCM 18918]|nr:hypothetical protein JCM18918_3318 [Cutibacterium acnes JCM 18918]